MCSLMHLMVIEPVVHLRKMMSVCMLIQSTSEVIKAESSRRRRSKCNWRKIRNGVGINSNCGNRSKENGHIVSPVWIRKSEHRAVTFAGACCAHHNNCYAPKARKCHYFALSTTENRIDIHSPTKRSNSSRMRCKLIVDDELWLPLPVKIKTLRRYCVSIWHCERVTPKMSMTSMAALSRNGCVWRRSTLRPQRLYSSMTLAMRSLQHSGDATIFERTHFAGYTLSNVKRVMHSKPVSTVRQQTNTYTHSCVASRACERDDCLFHSARDDTHRTWWRRRRYNTSTSITYSP